MAVADETAIAVDAHLIAIVKAHLLKEVIPRIDEMAQDGDTPAFEYRDLILSEWVAQAIKEKLDREMPTSKSKKQEIGLTAYPPYDTHL